MSEKNNIQELQSLVDELFKLLGVGAKGIVSFDETEKIYMVNIETQDEAGLLIGHRGEVIDSLQTVLGMMFKSKVGEWLPIEVNIGDWRDKQEDYLKGLATQSSLKAKESGEAQPIYNLKASERRIIHLFLSEDTEIETESVGDGANRYLLVKPKKV